MKKELLLLSFAAGMIQQTLATPFEYIRIGDNDGFGYNNTCNYSNLTGSSGGFADANRDGRLGVGDVLPNLGDNGSSVFTGVNSNDDFDNRNNESVTSVGATDRASSGSEFTDISLSNSYNESSTNNNVYSASNCSRGAGGSLPATAPYPQATFSFDFFVAQGDIVEGSSLYFNAVFGDYDITPGSIDLSYDNGSSDSVGFDFIPVDGIIQGASFVLDFYDIFTPTAGGWIGLLTVNANTPNDPYLAFDYVEISQVTEVSEPSALLILMLGLGGLVFRLRK